MLREAETNCFFFYRLLCAFVVSRLCRASCSQTPNTWWYFLVGLYVLLSFATGHCHPDTMWVHGKGDSCLTVAQTEHTHTHTHAKNTVCARKQLDAPRIKRIYSLHIYIIQLCTQRNVSSTQPFSLLFYVDYEKKEERERDGQSKRKSSGRPYDSKKKNPYSMPVGYFKTCYGCFSAAFRPYLN